MINPNDNDIYVFSPSDLTNTYNYKGAFSTKNNQFRVTRSAQGVALKQLGTLPYMQYNSKNWNHPIIFRHNSREDKVSITIDRQHGQIVPTFEYGNGVTTTTTVTRTQRLYLDYLFLWIKADTKS